MRSQRMRKPWASRIAWRKGCEPILEGHARRGGGRRGAGAGADVCGVRERKGAPDAVQAGRDHRAGRARHAGRRIVHDVAAPGCRRRSRPTGTATGSSSSCAGPGGGTSRRPRRARWRNGCSQNGVPRSAIVVEDKSTDTVENLNNAKAEMAARGLSTAIVVTSDYHLTRALWLARDQGLDARWRGRSGQRHLGPAHRVALPRGPELDQLRAGRNSEGPGVLALGRLREGLSRINRAPGGIPKDPVFRAFSSPKHVDGKEGLHAGNPPRLPLQKTQMPPLRGLRRVQAAPRDAQQTPALLRAAGEEGQKTEGLNPASFECFVKLSRGG